MARASFSIGGEAVPPGERRLVGLPVSLLPNRTPVELTVAVAHGRRDGPTLFVSAAIHGDEINGVAICQRLLASKALSITRGTLLVVPIVNTFGFIGHSRYLPDRRDLNRSFPGSARGSLAAQLADVFMTQVVARSDCGIDLHSAAVHRSNLPQIRVDSSNTAALKLARAFDAPIIVDSPHREGSLRKAASERGVPVIVYEGGEGLRVDEFAAGVGVRGILRVLAQLAMIRGRGRGRGGDRAPVLAMSSRWVRAEEGGLFRPFKQTGDRVAAGERIAAIGDAYGESETEVAACFAGIIVGRTNIPAVNRGDALFHIAAVEDPSRLQESYGSLERELGAERILDEDEIL